MVGELERLDPKIHEPLSNVTWGRDIDLREDVTIADETTSFMLSTYAASGGLGTGHGIGTGKNWIGKNTDQIAGVGLDLAKIPHPLRLWGMELKYTIPELESAARLGRPIDQQKFTGLQLKHQMDIDEQVYIGDLTMGDTGLVNSSTGPSPVPVTNVPGSATVAGAPTRWSLKTPDDILADINMALINTWTASAYASMPNRLLIPPTQFGYISTAKIGTAGQFSIMKYIMDNNILTTSGQGKLEILPLKWLVGAGAGGTIGVAGTVDRMIAYNKDKDKVRFPMTMLQRTPIQYVSIYQMTTYFCRLGVVEIVYPETMGYFDMI